MATAGRSFKIKGGPPIYDLTLCLYDFGSNRQVTFLIEHEGKTINLKCRIQSVTVDPQGPLILVGWAQVGTAGSGSTETPIIVRYKPKERSGEMEFNESIKAKSRQREKNHPRQRFLNWSDVKGSAVIHVRSDRTNVKARFDTGSK